MGALASAVASGSASCSTSLVLPNGSGLVGLLLLAGMLRLTAALTLASVLTLTAVLALNAALVETSSIARSLWCVAIPLWQAGTFGVFNM